MRRRSFIGLFGSAAVAWPFAARAQQPEPLRRIGVLMGSEPSDPQMQARLAAFNNGLRALGWSTGENLKVDAAWYGGSLKRATESAEQLADGRPDVIIATGTVGIEAVRKTTHSIPTVFVMVGNPVGSGFVESLAHPGGNVTGFSAFEPAIAGKWMQLLKETVPATRRVAVLFYPGYEFLWRGAEDAAAALGVEVTQATCHKTDEIERAIVAQPDRSATGLVVLPTPLFALNRDLIVRLAAQRHLPTVYPFRYYATAGGLMSYGIDAIDVYRRVSQYADRILKGEKPDDLPVQAPTKFELVINLKTAKALDVTVPPSILGGADEVIE
jgi:putative ABC transport system substrate-binding protein